MTANNPTGDIIVLDEKLIAEYRAMQAKGAKALKQMREAAAKRKKAGGGQNTLDAMLDGELLIGLVTPREYNTYVRTMRAPIESNHPLIKASSTAPKENKAGTVINSKEIYKRYSQRERGTR